MSISLIKFAALTMFICLSYGREFYAVTPLIEHSTPYSFIHTYPSFHQQAYSGGGLWGISPPPLEKWRLWCSWGFQSRPLPIKAIGLSNDSVYVYCLTFIDPMFVLWYCLTLNFARLIFLLAEKIFSALIYVNL